MRGADIRSLTERYLWGGISPLTRAGGTRTYRARALSGSPPRIRGADTPYSSRMCSYPGASPRTRSRPLVRAWRTVGHPSISAYAEQTPSAWRSIRRSTEHLRVSGAASCLSTRASGTPVHLRLPGANVDGKGGGDLEPGTSPPTRSRRQAGEPDAEAERAFPHSRSGLGSVDADSELVRRISTCAERTTSCAGTTDPHRAHLRLRGADA